MSISSQYGLREELRHREEARYEQRTLYFLVCLSDSPDIKITDQLVSSAGVHVTHEHKFRAVIPVTFRTKVINENPWCTKIVSKILLAFWQILMLFGKF